MWPCENIARMILLLFLLAKAFYSFKTMNISISNTSGLNTVDKNFKPQYFIKNELRFVTPYVFTYKLYTKKRWVGKQIEGVLNAEFRAYGNDYFKTSIKKGYIKVNQQVISPDYIMKDNDLIEHKLLLFEKPVLYKKILILYEDENFICANKPISMPTHPVGSYQYNSLLRILQNYLNFEKIKEKENKKEHKKKENIEENQKEESEIELEPKNAEFEDVAKVNFLFNFKEADLKEYEEQVKENLKKRKQRKRSSRGRPGTNEDVNFLCNDLKKKQKHEERHTVILDSFQRDETLTGIDVLNEENVKNGNVNEQSVEGKNFKNLHFHLGVKFNERESIKDNSISINGIDIAEEKMNNRNLYESRVGTSKKDVAPINSFSDEQQNTNRETLNERKNIDVKTENSNRNKNDAGEKHSRDNTNEEINGEDMYLYTLHRLDKFTSGIALFGKNKIFSTAFAQHLSTNKIKKTYITRVDGDFRLLIKKNLNENKILKYEEGEKLNSVIEQFCNNDKKKSLNFFKSSKCNGSTDINQSSTSDSEDVLKGDQFLYESNYENDSSVHEMKMKKLIDKIKTQKKDLEDFFDINKYREEYFSEQRVDNIEHIQKDTDKLIEEENDDEEKSKGRKMGGKKSDEYHKYFVVDLGYMYCRSKKTLKYVFVKRKDIRDAYVTKGKTIGKEGLNIFGDCDGSADFALKPAVTRFMFLSYNEKNDESLIICQPITGRTHQIRAHLESLNYPISNDPSYNKKFEKDYMKKCKYLHFVNPHFTDNNKSTDICMEELDSTQNDSREEKHISKKDPMKADCSDNDSKKYDQFPLIPFLNTSFNWLYDDYINLHSGYEQEFLKNYFFKKINNVTYHSSGIFLHSCRYSWDKVFDVFTLIPNWCEPFLIPPRILTFLTYGNIF